MAFGLPAFLAAIRVSNGISSHGLVNEIAICHSKHGLIAICAYVYMLEDLESSLGSGTEKDSEIGPTRNMQSNQYMYSL